MAKIAIDNGGHRGALKIRELYRSISRIPKFRAELQISMGNIAIVEWSRNNYDMRDNYDRYGENERKALVRKTIGMFLSRIQNV